MKAPPTAPASNQAPGAAPPPDRPADDEPNRGHPAQHEMLHKDLPKHAAAEAIEEFDADEN